MGLFQAFCCSCSVTKSCLTLYHPMDWGLPGFPVLNYLPEFAQIHAHWAGDASWPSHPLSSPSPALSLSQHQALFQWVSSSHQVAKVLELQLSSSVLPMNIQGCFPLGWTGLISLQSEGVSEFLQHHSLKASFLRCSAFFIVQLSHPYMNTGKTIALTIWTFVDKVMSLLFNMLSWLVITFLPSSKRLLISWLQSPSAVILEPQNTVNYIKFYWC